MNCEWKYVLSFLQFAYTLCRPSSEKISSIVDDALSLYKEGKYCGDLRALHSAVQSICPECFSVFIEDLPD